MNAESELTHSLTSLNLYDSLLDPGSIPEELLDYAGFYYGLDMHPEIALSFLDQNVQFRFASIQHDWGPALNDYSNHLFLSIDTEKIMKIMG